MLLGNKKRRVMVKISQNAKYDHFKNMTSNNNTTHIANVQTDVA